MIVFTIFSSKDCADVTVEVRLRSDLSFLEVVSLLTQILSQYDATQQVPSDIGTEDMFICGNQLQSQSHLRMIETWTKEIRFFI